MSAVSLPGPVLVIAAHGTRSDAGMRTTRELATAVAAARPDTPVELAFLDVAKPSLADVLDRTVDPAVVVPLLLSAGYHVTTDIPSVAAAHPDVRVARHLGPDPLLVAAVAGRLTEATTSSGKGTVALAAIGSSRGSAREEVEEAGRRLAELLGCPAQVLFLDDSLAESIAALEPPLAVATYLLADGGFLDSLREAVGDRGVVAEPIGVHPGLVALVWSRYDEVVTGRA